MRLPGGQGAAPPPCFAPASRASVSPHWQAVLRGTWDTPKLGSGEQGAALGAQHPLPHWAPRVPPFPSLPHNRDFGFPAGGSPTPAPSPGPGALQHRPLGPPGAAGCRMRLRDVDADARSTVAMAARRDALASRAARGAGERGPGAGRGLPAVRPGPEAGGGGRGGSVRAAPAAERGLEPVTSVEGGKQAAESGSAQPSGLPAGSGAVPTMPPPGRPWGTGGLR